MHSTDTTPWYRIPAVWLVIAIPSLTVAGCLFTIFLALTHPDPLVSDLSQTTAAPSVSRSA